MNTDEHVKAIKAAGDAVAVAFRQLCEAEERHDRARREECAASNAKNDAAKNLAAAKVKLDELIGPR